MGNWKTKEQEREYNRRYHLMKTYGLTPEDYDRMVEEQGGCCAICGEDQAKGRWGRLHVDHVPNSDPPIVRGLLCDRCNRIWVGHIEAMGIENVRRVLAYLEKYGSHNQDIRR